RQRFRQSPPPLTPGHIRCSLTVIPGLCFGRWLVADDRRTYMSIRTGAEYRESLRDGRTVYVNGERVKDVTAYPAFQGVVDTLAMLYDVQHDAATQALLTYPSPVDGKPVALSFLMAETAEEIDRRWKAEEFRAEATFGLMGRMPD